MSTFRSTKTYGHERGLSCAFRQWRAASHCRLIHGYALSFAFTFEAELDDHGWVMDFGGLTPLRRWLEDTFDHTVAVADDDPELFSFTTLHEAGIISMRVLPNGVGCERFAEHAARWLTNWLDVQSRRVSLISVEVREHGANSAIWLA